MFSAQTYSDRRNQLINQVDSGIILLLGNEESGMNYADNTYHFRQDSNFLYYCALDTASLAAIIDVDNGTTTIYGDELDINMIIWTGPLPTIKERAAQAGINHTAPAGKLADALSEAKSKGRKIHFLPPYRPENSIKLHRLLGISLDEIANGHSIELIKAVVNQRSIKTDEEIVELEKAVRITNEMHLTAMRMARPGILEAEVTAAVNAIPHKYDSHLSFPIICTVRGETLHNHHHHNTLESGQLLLVDAGGESKMHYAGDMTRTYPVDPIFTQKQKDVYNIVLSALDGSIDMVKPGVTYRAVHLNSAKIIARGLKDLGLMKGDIEEAVAAGAHALFFPHGLGHMMGLDVHDMEDLGEAYVGYTDTMKKSTQFGLKSLRLGRELEPGFVLTIEPGIYFIPALIDKWRAEGIHTDFINYAALDSYKDFGGIRIEDDYLITETGGRLLGDQVAKTIEAVEAERAG